MVEGAHLLGHPHGGAAEVGDEGLDERTLGRLGGEPEHGAREPVEVDGGAGEGHRGVHRGHPGPDRAGGLEDGQPVPAGGVHDVLALVEGAAVGEHPHDVGEHVVGDGEQEQVAVARDRGGLGTGDAREELGDPALRGVGLTRRRDHLVPRATERGAQDGADATSADDTHAHAGHLNLFRSNPSDHPLSLPRADRDGYRTTSFVFNDNGTVKFPCETPLAT